MFFGKTQQMKTPNMFLRWLTFFSVIVNVALSSLQDYIDIGGQSMREVTDRYDSLFVPAGYAFSIWGLIYLAFIIYAIIQLLPAQKDKPVYDALAVPVIAINLLGLCWQFAFRYNQVSLSVLIIIVMLVAGMVLFIRAQQGVWTQHRNPWLMVPASLFLGWISVATMANIALWLVAMGWQGGGISEGAWTMVLLAAALILSIFISIRYKNFIYPAVIAWATYAIFVSLQSESSRLAQAALYTAIGTFILTVIAAARKGKRYLEKHAH
jgi:hypothetical protein